MPYGPGGSADQVARLYGERLNAALGQQMIVEDKVFFAALVKELDIKLE
jgi:tripartite-type tricarboxylate transporter receptor subunit TctC